MSWTRWAEFVERRRRPLALLLVIIAAFSLWTARGVKIVHDPFALFMSNDPRIVHLQDFWATFGSDANFQLVLLEPDHGDPFAPAYLEALRALTDRLAAIPGVASVHSLANAESFEINEETLVTVPFLPPGPVTVEGAEAARRRAQRSALGKRLLLADDGRSSVIVLRFDEKIRNNEQFKPVLAAVDDAVAAAQGPSVTATTIGIPNVERYYVQQIRDDNRRFMVITLGILTVSMFLLFRSWSGALAPLVAVGTSAAVTVAVLTLFGVPFNVISFTIPTLILVVGISDSIHMLERFLEERRNGRSPAEAVRRSTASIGLAVFLTSTTTMAGFGSLLTARITAIREFGFWAAFGVGVAFAVTVLVIPLWLHFWPLPVRARDADTHHHDPIDRLLAALARWVTANPGKVIIAWAVVSVATITLSLGIKRDSRLLEELFDDDPLVAAERRVERSGFGVLPVEVDLIGEPGAFKDPAILAKVAEVQRWMDDHKTIARTGSFINVVEELHQAWLGYPGLFTTAEELGNVLLLAESSSGDELARWVTPDYGRMHIQASRYDTGLVAFHALEAEITAELDRVFAGTGVHAVLTGSSPIAARAIDAIVVDLISSLSTAFVVIALMMAVLFMSLRIGILSMVPNTAPLLFATAIMSVVGWHVRISSGLIFSVALGIAVDDTIHYLARYGAERKAGHAPLVATERTMRTAGRGMIWTTVLLVSGFLVLTISTFRGIFEFGLLTSCVLAAALVADLTLTPALMLKAERLVGREIRADRSGAAPPA